ncbi:MAG: hypothetical protein A3F54_01245 [Candidatus Kerfeldbacteria bacterium RIFCSPHIGHO2_12_FULL_48_17]|uniref:Large ribosomal subunit protein bL25 n=1 Tax=Candidatus Kerfeldbacteria bacterium RIFCSPHIGHO2_12_FULL_48_17 TaxID=1798542 RepID=A0A1G2B0D7_9BACT|nr:MAG: hypothetical protein A3F54_01245 [Candidatus Kerfeldbacteria bacterium RIFCSPHIGHO2_12_FULL_48_17]
MEALLLTSKIREEKRKNLKTLRESGYVPAELYGHGIKNQHISVLAKDFQKVYRQAGENTLIELVIDSQKPVKTLISDVQLDPVTDRIIHVDLQQIRMDEKIKTHIEFDFIGVSPAEKETGAIIVKDKTELEIECLPSDLIHEYKIDLAALKKVDDSIRVEDLKLPGTITILENPDTTIVHAAAPRSEEELAKLDEAVTEDVEAVEVEKTEKPEEEESAAAGEGEKKGKKDKPESGKTGK